MIVTHLQGSQIWYGPILRMNKGNDSSFRAAVVLGWWSEVDWEFPCPGVGLYVQFCALRFLGIQFRLP